MNTPKSSMKENLFKAWMVYAVLGFVCVSPVWAGETTDTAQIGSDDAKPFLEARAHEIKGRLEQMAKENPREFETFFNNIRNIRKKNLAELKETNPELFDKIKKEKHEKLEQLKQKNPERYEKIMEHKGLNRKQHLKWLEKNHPEAFEALENAPGETLRERLQYVKQQNPELAEKLRGERKEFLKDKWRSATPEEKKEWAANHPKAAEHVKNQINRERLGQVKEKRNFQKNGGHTGK